jgi:hypothetical protein
MPHAVGNHRAFYQLEKVHPTWREMGTVEFEPETEFARANERNRTTRPVPGCGWTLLYQVCEWPSIADLTAR